MDDREKAPRDTATVPAAQRFPLNLQGLPLFKLLLAFPSLPPPPPLSLFPFFFNTEYLSLCPGGWPLNLNIQQGALALPAVDGCKNGCWGPCLGQ